VVELCLNSLLHLHGVVLNNLSPGITLPLRLSIADWLGGGRDEDSELHDSKHSPNLFANTILIWVHNIINLPHFCRMYYLPSV
jgi:hypothetical protein